MAPRQREEKSGTEIEHVRERERDRDRDKERGREGERERERAREGGREGKQSDDMIKCQWITAHTRRYPLKSQRLGAQLH